MKHALMIIAHKNSKQLCHLVEVLRHPQVDIYIHLDKKWDISQSEIDDILNTNSNVRICKNRISGFLDTWSLCQIAYELMSMAFGSDDYGYYYLLSGQDYPIKSVENIVYTLNESYPQPLIDCTPLRRDNWIYSGFKWIRFNNMYRFVWRISTNKKIRKILLLPIYMIQAIVTYIYGSPYKRLQNEKCEIFGGSAWWALTGAEVETCIKEIKINSNIVKIFRLATTPEETFFQTMAMRSKNKALIRVNNPYEVMQNCMTYAYFFDENHKPTGHPYILTEDNYEMLCKKEQLFARKFDYESKSLIHRIDEEILCV